MRTHLVALLLLCGPAALRAAPIDPCLPDDATLVLTVNVRQLVDAPLAKQLFPQGPSAYFAAAPSFVREATQTFALDLTREVDALVLAGGAPQHFDRGVLILRGKFDLPKAHAAARAWAAKHPDGLQIVKAGGRLIYQWKVGNAPAACFLDDGTLVVAAVRAQIDECIARKDGKKTAAVSPEMKALLEKTDGRHGIRLALLVTEDLKKLLGSTPETERLFAHFVSFSGGCTVGDGFQITGALLTKDGKAAAEVRQFAEGLKAILSLAASDSKDNPTLRAAVVAAVKVGSAGPVVTLTGALTKEQIDKLPKAP